MGHPSTKDLLDILGAFLPTGENRGPSPVPGSHIGVGHGETTTSGTTSQDNHWVGVDHEEMGFLYARIYVCPFHSFPGDSPGTFGQ